MPHWLTENRKLPCRDCHSEFPAILRSAFATSDEHQRVFFDDTALPASLMDGNYCACKHPEPLPDVLSA